MKKIAVITICISFCFSLVHAQQMKVVFEDGFSNNTNKWATAPADENKALSISGGYYYFEQVRTTNSWVTYKKIPLATEKDFKIEASIRKVSGIQNNGYGIVFGRLDNDNEFQFEISGDGHFRVDKYEEGQFVEIKAWTGSKAISTGNGANNKLTISKSGAYYQYYINDQLVYTGDYEPGFGHEIGFTLSQNQKIGIDYLKVLSSLEVAEVSFEDNFKDNKNNWATAASDENKALSIENGFYYFEHKRTTDSWVTYKNIPISTQRDFVIEAQYKKVSGIQNNGYGLVFGREDNDNEFQFEISGDGHFRADKYVKGAFTEVKAWTKSTAIKEGNGSRNKLSVVKLGSSLEYYINDQLVFTDRFQPFFGDAIGLTISYNQKIGMDYLRVAYIGDKIAEKPEPYVKKPEPGADPLKDIPDDPIVLPSQKRIALIIGNAAYQFGGQLPNPVNDARSMKGALEKLGFTVIKYENCDLRTMKMAIDDFGKRLKDYDVGLFFYAGHGIQVDGSNYLIPCNAMLDNEQDVDYDCVRAGRVLAKMEASKTKTNIVILDACRDNPFERSWSRSVDGNGLAFMNAPQGSLIAYATSPGNTASDGVGSNGLYTSAILETIEEPGLTVMDMFQKVRAKVIQGSGGNQIPWESTSLIGRFYFKQ